MTVPDTSHADMGARTARAQPMPAREPLEAAATARLENYLRKARLAGPVSDEMELAVRDAWMVAWRSGGRFALEQSAQLARPEFVDAMVNVAAFLALTDGTGP